jgi:hypothetical protein
MEEAMMGARGGGRSRRSKAEARRGGAGMGGCGELICGWERQRRVGRETEGERVLGEGERGGEKVCFA